LAARTVHDASILLARPRPCFHLSILSSPPLAPPHLQGQAAATKECDPSTGARVPSVLALEVVGVGGVSWGPGGRPDDRLSVWNQPRLQHLLPSTPLASGTLQREPTHRTNGAFAGTPGGRTAALSD
jgi:hypothetical protein